MDETIVTPIDKVDVQDAREPYLIIISGHHVGKLFHLDSDEMVAGRTPDCGIWIEDNAISRKHFRIQRTGGTFIIEDLNSTNGTYINNRRVASAILKSGDKIQISKDTIIQFDYFDENRRVSEQKRYEMGVKDPVTATFNKSYFLQHIADEFSYSLRQNMPLSVLIFDIDHFKIINDTHGHLAGDQVLQEICQTVADIIREEDVFCRYGGEEFVIIMRNTPCQPAVNLAERIRCKIESTPMILMDDKEIKVTISLGVSTNIDKSFRDYVALLAEADRYLYQSKGAGRNRVSAACKPTA